MSVVNDGEAGKIGYSTYVKERLDGFGGEGGLIGLPADLTEFPEYTQRVMGGIDSAMPACVGPVAYRDLDAVRADIANLKAALDGADVEDAFLSAASPGVIAVFLQNQHYGSHEEYVAALADEMKKEYDEIHQAGIVLQIDCPDLAMTRQARLHEGPEPVQHVEVAPENLLGGTKAPSAREHREPAEQARRVLVQRLHAPPDRSGEGAVPLGRVARTAREHRQPVLEPGRRGSRDRARAAS